MTPPKSHILEVLDSVRGLNPIREQSDLVSLASCSFPKSIEVCFEKSSSSA